MPPSVKIRCEFLFRKFPVRTYPDRQSKYFFSTALSRGAVFHSKFEIVQAISIFKHNISTNTRLLLDDSAKYCTTFKLYSS